MSPDFTTKRCTKCGNEYPATTDFFYKHSGMKDGLRPNCKICSKKDFDNWSKNNSKRIYETNLKWKTSNPDKVKNYQAEWKRNNPERKRELDRLYRERNRDDIRKRQRSWSAENRDSVRESKKKYCQENPEKITEAKRKWKREHPESDREHSKHRRARKMNAEGKHTTQEILNLFREQGGYCFHCGTDLIPIGYHEDHWIPLSRGGSDQIENIRLLCQPCNQRKHNKLPCEWDKRYCD